MEFQYIKEYYKVPAQVGRIILFKGEELRISGANGAYLKAEDKDGTEHTLHPTWEIVYTEEIREPEIKLSKSKQRSKQRYQDYLSSETCMSFPEWLGIKPNEEKYFLSSY